MADMGGCDMVVLDAHWIELASRSVITQAHKLHREGGAPVGTFAEEWGSSPQSLAPPYAPGAQAPP